MVEQLHTHTYTYVCMCVNNNKVQENKPKIHFAESKMLDANIHMLEEFIIWHLWKRKVMDGKQISGYQGLGNWEAVD